MEFDEQYFHSGNIYFRNKGASIYTYLLPSEGRWPDICSYYLHYHIFIRSCNDETSWTCLCSAYILIYLYNVFLAQAWYYGNAVEVKKLLQCCVQTNWLTTKTILQYDVIHIYLEQGKRKIYRERVSWNLFLRQCQSWEENVLLQKQCAKKHRFR